MELLSAKWSDFDLDKAVWVLRPSRTKTNLVIDIPLAPPVVEWLQELKVFACGHAHLFPPRRLIHMKADLPRKNRFEHVSPDTLNVALKRLSLGDVEHFTVHDMRPTSDCAHAQQIPRRVELSRHAKGNRQACLSVQLILLAF